MCSGCCVCVCVFCLPPARKEKAEAADEFAPVAFFEPDELTYVELYSTPVVVQ